MVWTLATAIVGLEQVGQMACKSTYRRLQLGGNAGNWYKLGKLYEPLGIQRPARWSHVSKALTWQKLIRLAEIFHHACRFRHGLHTRSVLTQRVQTKTRQGLAGRVSLTAWEFVRYHADTFTSRVLH